MSKRKGFVVLRLLLLAEAFLNQAVSWTAKAIGVSARFCRSTPWPPGHRRGAVVQWGRSPCIRTGPRLAVATSGGSGAHLRLYDAVFQVRA